MPAFFFMPFGNYHYLRAVRGPDIEGIVSHYGTAGIGKDEGRSCNPQYSLFFPVLF